MATNDRPLPSINSAFVILNRVISMPSPGNAITLASVGALKSLLSGVLLINEQQKIFTNGFSALDESPMTAVYAMSVLLSTVMHFALPPVNNKWYALTIILHFVQLGLFMNWIGWVLNSECPLEEEITSFIVVAIISCFLEGPLLFYTHLAEWLWNASR